LSYAPFLSLRRISTPYSDAAAFRYTQRCAMLCARTTCLMPCALSAHGHRERRLA